MAEKQIPNNSSEEEFEEMYLSLELEDGSELECQIYTVFEANGQDYIVLIPVDESYNSNGEYFIQRYHENKDGTILTETIFDDEEFELASDAFDEYLDSCEFDELVDADE